MDEADARRWNGDQAASLVGVFAEIERLASAGKTLAAGSAEHTNGWRRAGHRSAEEWLARQTGTTVSDAAGVLATADRLGQLPATEQALRSGQLSADQAAAVTSGGAADRSAERRLLEDAGRESLSQLQRKAQAVRHAAGPVVESAEERARIHRSRYLRTW